MFCAADDHQGNFARLSFDADAEMMKLVVENFARALPPVSKDAQASLEFEVDSVSDAAVGAGAGNAEEVTRFFGLFERRGEAECDIADFAARELFRGFRNVPGKFEFLCEDVCGASGQQCERDAMAVLRTGETVDNFVDRTVTAAGNDELTAITAGAPCDFDRFARSGCFREVRQDASCFKDSASFIHFHAASIASTAGVRIVNQKSVMEFLHGLEMKRPVRSMAA